MIEYQDNLVGIEPEMLTGFFAGWPTPPTPETHYRVLQGSNRQILAVDPDAGRVVGFITAICDDVLAAYIPLLEVLPEYQSRGIGSELVRRMLNALEGFYMIDLVCDENMRTFYERFELIPVLGMVRRNFSAQSGRSRSTQG
jgi:ribosomal protein S18 acetylase RimI-like enzyme